MPAAGWSSLVARRAHNPKVAGSNPAPATQKRSAFAGFFYFLECNSHKIGEGGVPLWSTKRDSKTSVFGSWEHGWSLGIGQSGGLVLRTVELWHAAKSSSPRLIPGERRRLAARAATCPTVRTAPLRLRAITGSWAVRTIALEIYDRRGLAGSFVPPVSWATPRAKRGDVEIADQRRVPKHALGIRERSTFPGSPREEPELVGKSGVVRPAARRSVTLVFVLPDAPGSARRRTIAGSNGSGLALVTIPYTRQRR
jgi:hypothetical protein